MSDDPSGRINQLEEALAHHEVMVHDLSGEMAKQWQTIERMARKIKELEEKVATQIPLNDAPQGGEPPPPHY
ncbi:MAG: SlyX family protein [Rhodospirillales bacterium]|nr:SlyX family protein [Rhodospirillales bacterium]